MNARRSSFVLIAIIFVALDSRASSDVLRVLANYPGSTDKAIIANRKLLAQAIDRVERGAAAPGLGAADFQGLIAIDTVVSSTDWTNDWKTHDLARRADSDWAEDPWA